MVDARNFAVEFQSTILTFTLMKKLCISIVMLLASVSSAFATDDYVLSNINLTYHIYTIKNSSTARPRTPANPPVIYIDGHTVLFEAADFCDSIEIIDPYTEEVVFETVVSDSATQAILPEELNGVYEIRFCREGYYFAGMIEL